MKKLITLLIWVIWILPIRSQVDLTQDLNKLREVTNGVASPNKVLVLDGDKNISGIHSIKVDTIVGYVKLPTILNLIANGSGSAGSNPYSSLSGLTSILNGSNRTLYLGGPLLSSSYLEGNPNYTFSIGTLNKPFGNISLYQKSLNNSYYRYLNLNNNGFTFYDNDPNGSVSFNTPLKYTILPYSSNNWGSLSLVPKDYVDNAISNVNLNLVSGLLKYSNGSFNPYSLNEVTNTYPGFFWGNHGSTLQGITDLTYNGSFYANRISSFNGYGISSQSSSSPAIMGTSYGDYSAGRFVRASNGSNPTLAAIESNFLSSGDYNNPVLGVSRSIAGTGNLSGAMIYINDLPSTSGTKNYPSIKASTDGYLSFQFYPRVPNGTGAIAYLFDNRNLLTSGSYRARFYNQGANPIDFEANGSINIPSGAAFKINGVSLTSTIEASMTYPSSGIPNSTGSTWGTSYGTTGTGTSVVLSNSPTFTGVVSGITPTMVGAIPTTHPAYSISGLFPSGTSTLIVRGDDSRLSDARSASDVYPWAKFPNKPDYYDDDIKFGDVETNNASTSKHGYLPKLSGVASDIMHGDGTWSSNSLPLSSGALKYTNMSYNYYDDTTNTNGKPILFTGNQVPTKTTLVNINGKFSATSFYTYNGAGVYSRSSTNPAINGVSTGDYSAGYFQKIQMTAAPTMQSVENITGSTGTHNTANFHISRFISGTANITGDLVSLVDAPTTTGSKNYRTISAYLDGSLTFWLSPRVTNSSGNIAYFYDTKNTLTGTALRARFSNNGANPIDFEANGSINLPSGATFKVNGVDISSGGGSMTYPSSGIPNSTGSTWGTSYSTTGTGTNIVLANSPTITSPTLVTPAIGAATANSINKLAITAPANGSTLTIADSKTLTVNNTITISGVDGSTLNLKSLMDTLQALRNEINSLKNPSTPSIQTPDYVVAVDGNDNNPGTISEPFASLQKACSVAGPGDLIYVRGGTYLPAPVYRNGSSTSDHCIVWILNKSGTSTDTIKVENYPGETPIFDGAFWNYNYQKRGIMLEGTSSYWKFKGLTIRNLSQQVVGFSTGIHFYGADHNVIENCVIDHIGGPGVYQNTNSGNSPDYNSYLNCDSHHNYDPLSTTPGNNADGFQGFNGRYTLYRGCRSWENSDDGYDFYSHSGLVTLDGCIAFRNGFSTGDGCGIKLGGSAATKIAGTFTRIVRNCLSAYNQNVGFYENTMVCNMYLINNTSLYNGLKLTAAKGTGFNWATGTTNDTTILINNVSFGNYKKESFDATAFDTCNSWNPGVAALTREDFITLDTSGITNPRNPYGNYTAISFAKLKSGSDLADAGKVRAYGSSYLQAAPDLGAYESNYTKPPINVTKESETVTLLANMGSTPSSSRQDSINAIIKELKVNGYWDRIDKLQVLASHSNTGNTALIDWKNPTLSASVVGSVTWTKDQGIESDNTTSGINTGYNPSTFGGNYTLNSASMFLYITEDYAETGQYEAGINGSYDITMNLSATNLRNNYQINVNGSIVNSSNNSIKSVVGLHAITRNGNSCTSYYNGFRGSVNTSTPTGIPNGELWAVGISGGPSGTKRTALWMTMGGITDNESEEISNIINKWKWW